jgi:inosine/xanthosine triphosphatase
MKIAVGSKNPVKIACVKEAFDKVFPDETWEVEGVDVESGVSDQPMSDVESITGARNRANRAREALDADYGVGLEGGLQQIEDNWFDAGWMVIVDRKGNEGLGSTIRMLTPEKMMDLIKSGMELGHVNDKLFGVENSKHGEGHFGLLTNGAITRTAGYRDGVISALARFIKPEVF